MAKPSVVSLAAERKKRAAAKRKRKPRAPKVDLLKDYANEAGVVFEIISRDGESENNYAHRIRFRTITKGGLGEHCYDIGNREYLVGDIQEQIGKKWTPWGFGVFPNELVGSMRMVIEPPAPVEAPKDDKK